MVLNKFKQILHYLGFGRKNNISKNLVIKQKPGFICYEIGLVKNNYDSNGDDNTNHANTNHAVSQSHSAINIINPSGSDLENKINNQKYSNQIAEENRLASSSELKTAKRSELVSSNDWRAIKRLDKKKKQATSCEERKKLEKRMKKIRKSAVYETPPLRSFTDIFDTLIGRAYLSDRKNNGGIIIGSDKYIDGILFDFTRYESKEDFNDNAKEDGNYYIRTVAMITEKGKPVLRNFLEDYLKNTHTWDFESNTIGRHIDADLDRQLRIYNKLNQKNAFDVKIKGLYVHINQKGKVEIFTSCDMLAGMLMCVKKINRNKKQLFKEFTRYAPEKKWIRQTSQRLNNTIGKSFKLLSKVLKEIYSPKFVNYNP